MRVPRERFTVRRIMILVAVVAVTWPIVYAILFLAVWSLMGFAPRSESEVIAQATDEMISVDPSFRIEDHEVIVQWAAGDRVIHFIHKISQERRCLRWIDTFPYGAIMEIKCPPPLASPGG